MGDLLFDWIGTTNAWFFFCKCLYSNATELKSRQIGGHLYNDNFPYKVTGYSLRRVHVCIHKDEILCVFVCTQKGKRNHFECQNGRRNRSLNRRRFIYFLDQQLGH